MRDPLYEEVKVTVTGAETWSINQLMRKFDIGYNRAAWYAEYLVEDGILSDEVDIYGCRNTINHPAKRMAPCTT